MGHSKQDKAASHDRIVEIASARIRESGTATPGVAEIMQAAGLTHGGFYKHFASRDDLIAEAVDKTFADGNAATAAVIADAEDPLVAFVDWYASAGHCEDPATGCGVVALGADVSRAAPAVRAAYGEQMERYLDLLEGLLGGGSDARARAIGALTTLVGAVLTARAVDDAALAEELLAGARAQVVALRT